MRALLRARIRCVSSVKKVDALNRNDIEVRCSEGNCELPSSQLMHATHTLQSLTWRDGGRKRSNFQLAMLATAHFTVLIEIVTHTFPHSLVRAVVCHKFGVCGFARMRAFIFSTCASVRRAMLTISVIPALSQRRINSRRSMSERTVALAIVKSCEPPPCTLRRAPLAVVACRAASRVPSYEPASKRCLVS